MMRTNDRAVAKLSITLAVLVLILTGSSCSSSDDNEMTPPGLEAGFEPTSTTPAANGARLAMGSSSGSRLTLDVVIQGPTSDQDLYSAAFDLLIGDSSVVGFVPGSATFGPAWTLDGAQGSEVLVEQSGNRIVVGVSKTGGGDGNGFGNGANTILSLDLEVKKAGVSTICIGGAQGTCGSPQMGPSVLDSDGGEVGSIQFDSQQATITGR